MIYLDNSATTLIEPAALQSYQEVSTKMFGNPSSLHRLGHDASVMLKKARQQIADLFAVNSDEIYFTASGTESNNWVIKGTAFEKQPFGKHIITTKIEHPSVRQSVKQLAQLGFEVDYVDVDTNGCVQVEQLKKLLRKDTILVSVMAVNNEIGSVQPIQEIAELLVEYPSIHFHVDAVQAVDRVQSLARLKRVDFITLSAHKFHGPRGVGIVFKRHGKKIQPLLAGGGQESNLRSSTENLPAIVATAKALRLYLEREEQRSQLKEQCLAFLKANDRITVFTPEQSAPHIICFALRGVRGEVLVHALEEHDIYVSTTSACSSKKADQTSTLKAMNIPDEVAAGAIRISFSKQTTEVEVKKFLEILEQLIKKFVFFK